MQWKRVKAVFIKQLADTAHNNGVFIQFLAYPIFMFLLLIALPDGKIENRITIVLTLSTTFTGMMPALIINNIIKEDKVQNTLRVLILSTVKPLEYITGITGFILLVSLINAFIFGLLGGLYGIKLLLFIGVMLLGITTTLIFGSAMAISSASQVGSGGLIMLISMLNGTIPVLSSLNKSYGKVLQFLYTYQIKNMLGDIYDSNFVWYRIAIVFVNFILFLILFIISYKNNRFYE